MFVEAIEGFTYICVPMKSDCQTALKVLILIEVLRFSLVSQPRKKIVSALIINLVNFEEIVLDFNRLRNLYSFKANALGLQSIGSLYLIIYDKKW